MSSPRPQVMRPEGVCMVCLKLLEMLPSKRLHNPFQMVQVKKMFYRRSERVFEIENPSSPKRFYFNFKS